MILYARVNSFLALSPLKAVNFEYFLTFKSIFSAGYIHLIWMQVKTYILTCLSEEKNNENNSSKMFLVLGSPYPLMGWSRLLGGVNGSNGVSAKSQPHTRSLQHVFNVTKFK